MFDVNIKKAEYYSLQEACDYLNAKHNTTNANTDNLLKHIVSYEVPTYVFARGFELTGDYATHSMNNYYLKEIEFNKTSKSEFPEEKPNNDLIINFINEELTGKCKEGGLFLKVANTLITYFHLHGKVDTRAEDGLLFEDCSYFDGALSVDALSSSSEDLSFTKIHSKRFFNDYIEQVVDIYPSIIIPLYELDNFESLESLLAYYFSETSLKIIDYSVLEDNEDYLVLRPYIEITKADLIVLHRDLIDLENKIVNNSPIPYKMDGRHQGFSKEPMTDSKLKPREKIDPRTKNNFIRVMLAVNEMAKKKQGNHLHIGEKFSSKNLDKLNIEIEKQGHKAIGERAYKTLMSMINEVR